ncbi:hypothetical protein HDZ31DRAFT_39424, partial [Schizophyllum fasciatum]
ADLPPFPADFKGDVINRGHPDYRDAIRRWARSAERQAAVVAFIKDSSDAAIAIAYARSNGLPLAIRGGGHSSAGASSSEDGLVVDCSRYLDTCRVDTASKVAYVGGGATWSKVDRAAYEQNLSAVAGTVNCTGVAGLTLGGGFGYLSGQYGLVIDNLLQATVVTAKGDKLTASPSENSDLFYGIRGGGSNFGVVTEFVFRLHDQKPTVFGGLLTYPHTACPSVMLAFRRYWDIQDPKACAFALFAAAPMGSITCTLFYDGSEDEGRAHFKEFYDIGPSSDSTKAMPYVTANTMMDQFFPSGRCDYQKSIAHPVPTAWLAEQCLQKVEEYNFRGGPSAMVMFYAWPKPCIIRQYLEGAYQHTRHPELVFAAVYEDDTPKNAKLAKAIALELHALVIASDDISTMTLSECAGYGNHDAEAASSELQKRAESARHAFGEAYARLQELKLRYDPDMVFDKWRPIMPA